MEIRYVVSRIATQYNLALAPGQSPDTFAAGSFDTFTIRLAPLHMVLQRREKVEN